MLGTDDLRAGDSPKNPTCIVARALHVGLLRASQAEAEDEKTGHGVGNSRGSGDANH